MKLLSGWEAKPIRIVIDSDKIEEDLDDFLLDIYIDSLLVDSVPIRSDFYSNRKKLAVTLDDGITQCFCAVYFTKVVAKVPFVSCEEDTVLYLYYDPTHGDNDRYVGDPGSDVVTDNMYLSWGELT